MQAWNSFLEELEKKLGPSSLKPWINGFKVVNFDAQNLYLEAKDAFHLHWFEEHIRPFAKQAFRNNNARLVKIHLSLSLDGKKNNDALSPSSPKPLFTFQTLGKEYRFDNFVADETNGLIFELLKQIKPGFTKEGYNPIFLWGLPGTGKTHLLKATCLKLQSEGFTASYVHASDFTDQVVQAIRLSKVSDFRSIYRKLDLLAIDDIHLFSKKLATQEEFFHTFNALHLSGKVILVGSRCAPHELKEVEPRLISRFEWGLSLQMENVTPTELKKILKQRLEELDLPLEEESTCFLLKHFSSSMALLYRAIDTLILRAHLEDRSYLSPTEVQTILEDLLQKMSKTLLTPETILDITSETFSVKIKDLLGKSQAKLYVIPRQIAMYFLRHKLHMPYKKIGEVFSRDHSTVISSIRLVADKIKEGSSDHFPEIKAILRLLDEKEKAPF